MKDTPPVWQLIKDAIAELGGSATNAEIRDAIHARYPDVNPGTINAQINFCSVNSPSRIHGPENSKPRSATDPRYDFLFRVRHGHVLSYDPKQHGVWSIVQDSNGHLKVSRSG